MLPQDLIDQLNAAEALLASATQKDRDHDTAAGALAVATTAEQKSAADALDAHQAANTSAATVLAALKSHFGLS
jgi:hypothetical protein